MEKVDYSKDGKIARAILYEDLNDIHIFVEDWEEEYIYIEILEKLLSDMDIKIRTVNCMGSKKDVIDVYKEHGYKIKNTPCYYIVDGDFDRMVDINHMFIDTNFYYLKRYNLESYYINKESTIRHIQGKVANTYDYIDKRLGYDNWEKQIDGDFYELFLAFVYVQKNNLPFSNASLNHSRNFLDEKGYVDKKIFYDYIEKIGLDKKSWEIEKQELNNLFEKINGKNQKLRLICGKFILTALNKLYMVKMNGHFNMQELIWDLVRNIKLEPFDDLKEGLVYTANKKEI